MVIELDGFSKYSGVCAEGSLPERVAEHHDGRFAFHLHVRWANDAALRGRHAEHGKIVAGDQFAYDEFCRAMIQSQPRTAAAGEAGKRMSLLAVIEVIGISEAEVGIILLQALEC